MSSAVEAPPIATRIERKVSPLAGRPAPRELQIDVAQLETQFYRCQPDRLDPRQKVAFGTSGHRGSPLDGTFTQAHVLAITQAICDHRRSHGVTGPLYLGKDTHALSGPAQRAALEVLAANRVTTIVQEGDGFTTTPAISHAILAHNRAEREKLADGIVITPSHNPPEQGGLKYNATNGGPADIETTAWIERRANELLDAGNADVRQASYSVAMGADSTHQDDLIEPYVRDLENVVDLEAIRDAGLTVAVDPMGGASLPYWEAIDEKYGLELDIVNRALDPTFSFMTCDQDGKIRMDCSSRFAMARLVGLKDRYPLLVANDPDGDRHGIVVPRVGLMEPNHFLAVAVRYLLTHRPGWRAAAVVGKTLVTSALLDRVVARLGRTLCEVPVGFQWFAPGLLDTSFCFGGEESAGASFLRRDGSSWTTDKDGIAMALLAAEITARSGKSLAEHYRELTAECGTPCYQRIDVPASPEQKAGLATLSPEAVRASHLAGEPILGKLTHAAGNGAPIGGLKVVTENGWFAARPSGTEDFYKIYAESFQGVAHLESIVAEAQEIVEGALASGAATPGGGPCTR